MSRLALYQFYRSVLSWVSGCAKHFFFFFFLIAGHMSEKVFLKCVFAEVKWAHTLCGRISETSRRATGKLEHFTLVCTTRSADCCSRYPVSKFHIKSTGDFKARSSILSLWSNLFCLFLITDFKRVYSVTPCRPHMSYQSRTVERVYHFKVAIASTLSNSSSCSSSSSSSSNSRTSSLNSYGGGGGGGDSGNNSSS